MIAGIKKKEGQITSNLFILGERFPDACPRHCDGCTVQDCKEAPKRRLSVFDILERLGSNVAIFEDCEKVARASVDEELILMDPMIDRVIVLPESIGSVAELVDFSHNETIMPKMLVFVKRRYHPQHGESKSYLRDFLRKFDARGGRVYYFESDAQLIKDIGDIHGYYQGVKTINELKKS
jgi:hypothetical protein